MRENWLSAHITELRLHSRLAWGHGNENEHHSHLLTIGDLTQPHLVTEYTDQGSNLASVSFNFLKLSFNIFTALQFLQFILHVLGKVINLN